MQDHVSYSIDDVKFRVILRCAILIEVRDDNGTNVLLGGGHFYGIKKSPGRILQGVDKINVTPASQNTGIVISISQTAIDFSGGFRGGCGGAAAPPWRPYRKI